MMVWDNHLVFCIREGNNAEVQSILEDINPLDVVDKTSGTTLLHVAAECGNATVTKYLIEAGCTIDAVDDLGNTPLILASQRSHRRVIRELVKANASVLTTNNNGQSAAKLVIPITEWIWDRVPAVPGVMQRLKEELSNDSLLTAKKLLELYCPFSQALLLKDTVITEYMLENGCNVDDRVNDNGNTALHQAVKLSDLENVKLLLARGADVNAPVDRDWTTLLYVSDKTDEGCEILRILLDHGARLFDDEGRFLLSHLFYRGKRETITYLIERYNLDFMMNVSTLDGSLVYFIAFNKNFDTTELMKSRPFDVNVRGRRNSTVLMHVLTTKNVRAAEFLLANGADVNAFDVGRMTALFRVFYSYICTVRPITKEIGLKYIELLLEYGIDTQFQYQCSDGEVRTIFNVASEQKAFILIKPILAHLAMREALGDKIKDIIRNKINSEAMFRSYFDFCKRTIAKMKRTTVQRTATLFQCLTGDRVENVIKLSRNEKLVSQLESMMYFKRRSNLYYHKVLRKRVFKMVKMVNLRKKVVDVLSEIQELQMNAIVIKKIVDYVISDDLKAIATKHFHDE